MGVELPVISFICATILTVFIPVRRIRENIANLSIVTCLIGCNVIHGINTILWTGNVNIHIPVWCDIVTKLLLGAMVALPAGCLCISRHLEFISSNRKIPCDAHSKRNRYLIDISLCYILPIIYLSLHSIGQDHRFDLVKDFGCSASIHPSTPALIVIWLPPLIICSISFVFSALAIYNSYRLSSARFSSHLSARSPVSSSVFVRRLVTSIMSTGVLTITILFSLFYPTLEPWISWSSVHAHFYDIDIVQSREEIRSVQLSWWGIPAVSIIYILLSFTIGEETREVVQRIQERISRRSAPSNPLLVLRTYNNEWEPGTVSRSSSLTTPRSRPQTIELKSGWDDMLESPKRTRSKAKPKFIPSHPESSCPSPSRSSSCQEDDAFMTSTLTYLGSPTAHILGLPPRPITSSLVYTSPQKAAHDILPCKPIPTHTPVDSPRELDMVRLSGYIPEDTASTISSIWNAPWPQPPSSISSSHHASRSRSDSPTPSNDTFGCPPITPLQMGLSLGPNVSPVPSVSSPPKSKQVEKSPSIKNLRRSWSRDGLGHGHGYAPGEVIYMSVVKETV